MGYLSQRAALGVAGFYLGEPSLGSALSYYGNEYEQDALDTEALIGRAYSQGWQPLSIKVTNTIMDN